MRKYPDKDKRWELRRLIDEAELGLEVSELEKVLSQLAFLMELNIQRNDELKRGLSDLVGNAAVPGELPSETLKELDAIAKTIYARSGLILFWMWRSWILQKDLCAEDGKGTGTQNAFDEERDDDEWEWLPSEIRNARSENIEMLESLHEELNSLASELASVGPDSQYTLKNSQGSPLAVIAATEFVLNGRLGLMKAFREKVQLEYGFGRHHRPNKRFDRMTVRDIRTYFLSKRGETDGEYFGPFLISSKGKAVSDAKAKTAADKVASRYEANLADFHDFLRHVEKEGIAPTRFYARRLAL